MKEQTKVRIVSGIILTIVFIPFIVLITLGVVNYVWG